MKWLVSVVWTTWELDDKFSSFSFYLQTADTNLFQGQQEHILQSQWLWIIPKQQKREITFSDDVKF